MLGEWILIFGEHYRAKVSQPSIDAYFEGLSDLTAAEIDAACKYALLTSEYMPVVATIRAARATLQYNGAPVYGKPAYLDEPQPSAEERELTPEEEDRINKLKQTLGLSARTETTATTPLPTPRKVTPIHSQRSLEEQKAELRKRGFIA